MTVQNSFGECRLIQRPRLKESVRQPDCNDEGFYMIPSALAKGVEDL
jgi:hypothetical protein